MFQPMMVGREVLPIHQAVWDVIQKCDIDLRADLAENIVLAGGNTMFPGFAERLQKELENLAPALMTVSIEAQEDRLLSVWNGGSILASLEAFQPNWVDR